MKRDFNQWLASLGAKAPVKNLTELREWNVRHQKAGAIKYGQAQLDVSDEMDVEADRARYQADRAKDLRLSATNGIDAVMKEHRLDALLFPGANGYAIPAKPGYPTIIVPFGFVPNAPTPRLPRRLQRKSCAIRRELHRDGMQRTTAHRACLRIRAGHETPCAPAGDTLSLKQVRLMGQFSPRVAGCLLRSWIHVSSRNSRWNCLAKKRKICGKFLPRSVMWQRSRGSGREQSLTAGLSGEVERSSSYHVYNQTFNGCCLEGIYVI